jgi:hypothetical protein
MREQYIKMRNSKQVDIGLLYTYAREHGLNMTIDQFAVGAQFTHSEMIEYLDRKFQLTLVYDKNGNFVKVVE